MECPESRLGYISESGELSSSEIIVSFNEGTIFRFGSTI